MCRLVCILIILCPTILVAQKYKAETSEVSFFSEAPIENITASTKQGTSLFNRQTGEIAFSIPIKSFVFEKALMQEHFNEKYMESDKFPRATFSGIISNLNESGIGEQEVTARGKLTIHGVTHAVEIRGSSVDEGINLQLQAKFKIRLKDYNISIPQLLFRNIAEEVDVSVNFTYKPI